MIVMSQKVKVFHIAISLCNDMVRKFNKDKQKVKKD